MLRALDMKSVSSLIMLRSTYRASLTHGGGRVLAIAFVLVDNELS